MIREHGAMKREITSWLDTKKERITIKICSILSMGNCIVLRELQHSIITERISSLMKVQQVRILIDSFEDLKMENL